MNTVIYMPESPIKNPRKMLRDMWNDLDSSFYLARKLAFRDISAQYRQTALGYFWAILPPLINTIIWVFLNATNVVKIENAGIPYPAYVFVGTILWQLFIESITAPLKQISVNRSMLTRINHPKEAIVLSGQIQVLFSFMVKIIVLLPALLFFRVDIKGTALLLPIPFLGLMLLGTIIGLFILPVGALYKDVQEGINIITLPLMYLAPVVYPMPNVGFLRHAMLFNPVTYLITASRECLYGSMSDAFVYSIGICVAAFLLMICGWILYRVALPILIERMDA